MTRKAKMKEKIDFSLIGALLKKQRIETIYPYRKGQFDVIGFLLKLILIGAIIALFAVFFGKFTDMFLKIRQDGSYNFGIRSTELLSVIYSCVIIFMVISGMGEINRQIFAADDVKIFSAMPVGAGSLYIAKLISIYLGQLLISIAVVLTVNITFAVSFAQAAASVNVEAALGASFWIATVLECFLMPLITITIASILALPYNFIKRFLSNKYLVTFIIITAITGVAFYLYSIVLNAVQQMLVGDDLRYFFNEATMNVIGGIAAWLYPARWLVNLMLESEILVSAIGIAALFVVCLIVSMAIIRSILRRALQSRMAGAPNFVKKNGSIKPDTNSFFELVKKDFLLIFRTPSYMFSYFSVALIMPLMVYFCMAVGSSIVTRLIGMEFDLELALLLTLLFGALTNIFCATNISRDGQMFYIVKAMPIGHNTVFFSKIFLCMAVTVLSQLASAILLLATGCVNWYSAIFLFVVGTLFSFVNICVATRYDFNHAHFSTEEDGEIKESSNVVSTIIMLGIVASFLVGGGVFLLRIALQFWNTDVYLGWLSYLVSGVAAVVAALLSWLYLTNRLGKKYYEFQGGNI